MILVRLKKIAKTGSLCCVAARPHGSNVISRDWSIGTHEPYWQTNTSFSPPPSRWHFRFPSEDLPYDFPEGNFLCGSSTSSNSKASRWARGNHLSQYHNASDGRELFLSSSPDISQGPQWIPPAIQEISVDDYEIATRRGQVLGQLPSTPTMEGISGNADGGGSTSSHSDNGESELTFSSCLSSHRNFSSRPSFLSKPIFPLSFPNQTPGEASDSLAAGFSDFDANILQRDAHRWSSASSGTDFADVSELFESEHFSQSSVPSDGFKCGLCEKYLSQRSPWSSRRIMRSGDMPIAGILSCRHVFHAECLDQTTPKVHKSDPPCPLCVRLEEVNSSELRVFSTLRNSFPRLRTFPEEGPSRPWGCVQMGDFVEGALHAPPGNTMLLNQNLIKKNLSLKVNSSKEFPGKLRKSGSYSSQLCGKSVDTGAVGCSKTMPGPSMKK